MTIMYSLMLTLYLSHGSTLLTANFHLIARSISLMTALFSFLKEGVNGLTIRVITQVS